MLNDLDEKTVGVVVPTLGTREDYLLDCLSSVRASGSCYIILVAPRSYDAEFLLSRGLIDELAHDQGNGLASAINLGIACLPKHVVFATWIGDDDLLCQQSLEPSRDLLKRDSDVVLVYGNCIYIDSSGRKVWKNSFGRISAIILRFGPCLIPQPGSLFRRSAYEEVGGLNPDFGWAFDYDLFIRLSKVGKLKYVDRNTASFRWHSDSLTVGQRKKSVNEASRVRKSNYSKGTKALAIIWEPIVKFITLHAPKIFDRKQKEF
jgi:GT2 family glycosyltransferase